MLERDDAAYTYAYSVVSGVPLRTHRASFTVVPAEGGCRIIWHTEAEREDPEIDMEAATGGSPTRSAQAAVGDRSPQ